MTEPHAISGRKRILVTGGAGFIGANLASRLAQHGHEVVVYDSLARPGVRDNLTRLKARHGDRIDVRTCDVRDRGALEDALRGADAVYHMAAQVAVTTSLLDPREDFEVNLCGTMNVLEAARRSETPPVVIFSSTNKVYGDLADIKLSLTSRGYRPMTAEQAQQGIGADRPISFHTPYGCSKGAADQYVLDYARSFGLRTLVLRMSCIYGPWQKGTEDQGWVAHFILRALRGEPITIYGDGHQVRDVLYIDDAVDAYLRAWETIDRNKGQVFNLGGGPNNAISLLELLSFIEQRIGRPIDLNFDDWRQGDQRYFVTDIRRTLSALALGEPTAWTRGVDRLIEWLRQELRPALQDITTEAAQ